MRIIEIDDEKYDVFREVASKDEDVVKELNEIYKERYSDFVLLKSKENPTIGEHYLLCRKIEDSEFEAINESADVIES